MSVSPRRGRLRQEVDQCRLGSASFPSLVPSSCCRVQMMEPAEEETFREDGGGQHRCSDRPSLTFPSVLQRCPVPGVLAGETEAVSGPVRTHGVMGALQTLRVTFTSAAYTFVHVPNRKGAESPEHEAQVSLSKRSKLRNRIVIQHQAVHVSFHAQTRAPLLPLNIWL